MADNPGIEAAFCDVRKVDGRQVMKLIFEVDISMRNMVLERMGGYPDGKQWALIVPFTRPET